MPVAARVTRRLRQFGAGGRSGVGLFPTNDSPGNPASYKP